MIHPSSMRPRPFQSLTKDPSDMATLLQAERNAPSILLNDWTHELSDTIYAQYYQTGAFPFCVDSILANGLGKVECLPQPILEAGTNLGLSPSSAMDTPSFSTMMNSGPMVNDTGSISVSMAGMSPSPSIMMNSGPTASDSASMSMSMAGMSPSPSIMMHSRAMESSAASMFMSIANMSPSSSTMSSNAMASAGSSMPMTGLSPRGCTPTMMFRQGLNGSSLPLDTCANSTSTLLNIPANTTEGWLALNLVNSGGVSMLRVSLDSHSMYVYMADGLYVDVQNVKVCGIQPYIMHCFIATDYIQVLEIGIGQRYSVLIKLDQTSGSYAFRYATYPAGDMQQVLQSHSIVSYNVNLCSWNLPRAQLTTFSRTTER